MNYESISISISPNNEIGGVAELDEVSADPTKNDEEIKKTIESNEETINDLANVIDYYENFVGLNILSLESINADNCNTTGQLTIKGSFSNDFKEQINFDLSLTYPNVELRCELNKVSENTLTTINYMTQEKIISIGNIVIEQKLVKKKNKELFLTKGKSFNFDGKR